LREGILAGLRDIARDPTIGDYRGGYAYMTAYLRRLAGNDPQLLEALDAADRALGQRETETHQRLIRDALDAAKNLTGKF
jgi:hypothetical protein